MRKVVTFIEMIFLFLLQTTLFPKIPFLSVVPNLLLILTVANGFVNGKKSVGDAIGDVAAAGVRGGATGYASAVAGSAAAGATGGLLAASGIGAAVGGTAVGAVCVTAAPLVAGFAVSCAVANFVSDLWDEIF